MEHKKQYSKEELEQKWAELEDVLINYPNEETGEYLDCNPDGEINSNWFRFPAGTSKLYIWNWFDKQYQAYNKTGIYALVFNDTHAQKGEK